MRLLCQIGFHAWTGCTCVKCDAVRHEWNGCKCQNPGCTETRHEWNHCTCSLCGAERDSIWGILSKHHDWDGCRCRVCGKVDHKGDQKVCLSCGALNLNKIANDAGKMLFEVVGLGKIARFALYNPRGVAFEKASDRESSLKNIWNLRRDLDNQLSPKEQSQFFHNVGSTCVSQFNFALMLSAKLTGRSQWDTPHYSAPDIIKKLTPLIKIMFQSDQDNLATDPPENWISLVEQAIAALPKNRFTQ